MSVFSKRSNSYKAGVVFLLVGFVMFIAGFASPYWTKCALNFDSHLDGIDTVGHYLSLTIEVHGHNGLWTSCVQMHSQHMHCDSISHRPAWLVAVRCLQCLALLGLVAASCYAVSVNWILRNPAHNRLVEIVAGLSGLVGFVGMIEYMIQARTEDHEKVFSDASLLIGLSLKYSHVSWGFGLTVCGCVMSFLAAIVVAFNNQPLQAQINPERRQSSNIGHISNVNHANPAGYATNVNHGNHAGCATNVNHGNHAGCATSVNHANHAGCATNVSPVSNVNYANNGSPANAMHCSNPVSAAGYANNVSHTNHVVGHVNAGGFANNVSPMNAQNPVTFVSSQPGMPATNFQVFYVPPINISTSPPAMDRPPAYEVQYPPVVPSQPPPVAQPGPPMASATDPGQDGDSAAAATPVVSSLPPEDKKGMPQVP